MSFCKIVIFFLLIPLGSVAQNGAHVIEESQDIHIPFTVTQFDLNNNLSQKQVTAITSKKNGNLLIATENGIVEYNGFDFIPLPQEDKYASIIYEKLIWNEESNRLFGQEYKGAFHQVYPSHIEFDESVAGDMQKNVAYVIHADGIVYAANIKGMQPIKLAETGLTNARHLFVDSTDMYIVTPDSLYHLDLKTNKISKGPAYEIHGFKKNPFSGEVYAFNSKGIRKVKGTVYDQVFNITDIERNKYSVIRDFDFFGQDEYFVALATGLVIKAKEDKTIYIKQKALPSLFISSLCYNMDESCLFIGSHDKSLLKLQYKNCNTLLYNDDFNSPGSLSSVIQTKKGEVLVSDINGNIYQYLPGSLYKYLDLKQGTCASLSEIDGNLFAGIWNQGLKVYKDKKLIKEISVGSGSLNNTVTSSFKDSRNNIWLGTWNGVAKGTSLYNIQGCLKDKIRGPIIHFYELKNGTLCIGGKLGAFLVDTNFNVIKHLDKASGLGGREVRSFYEDKEGKLWIGTYGGGLYCYYKGRLTHINKLKNCMLDKDAFCLAPDGMGYLYMTSNHGLWRVREKDLSDFYYYKKGHLIPFYYGEETGILNTEFNGGFQNNFLRTSQNELFFPTQQGLVMVQPELLSYKKLSPVIYRVLVNDTLNTEASPVLERNTQSIRFDFTCERVLNKYNIYYQYKLENEQSSAWSPLQKEKTVNLKLLPAGNYVFSVRAIDGFNEATPVVTQYAFAIRPYFYETICFKLLAVLIIVVILMVIFKLRVSYREKKIEQKAFYQRHILELELNAIQAKLDPHFIFNCINNIKYFILEHDYVNANEGLNKISKLIRSSVEHSDELFVTLGQELTFITNYIDLEKMRLHDQLEYKICIEDRINENLLIPHLLIQPYIENAIKHGISNLTDRVGVLTVDLKEQENSIVCTITDNGIGRKAAKALSAKNSLHISRGIDLSKEKSILLNDYYKYECKIKVMDLYAEGRSNGTLVVIEMPKSYYPHVALNIQ